MTHDHTPETCACNHPVATAITPVKKKVEDPAFCTCSSTLGADALPEPGQRLRVTLLKDVDSWEGQTRTVISAGTTYEGVVTKIDLEGFFDMIFDDGQSKGFYVHDKTIRIDVFITENAVI